MKIPLKIPFSDIDHRSLKENENSLRQRKYWAEFIKKILFFSVSTGPRSQPEERHRRVRNCVHSMHAWWDWLLRRRTHRKQADWRRRIRTTTTTYPNSKQATLYQYTAIELGRGRERERETSNDDLTTARRLKGEAKLFYTQSTASSTSGTCNSTVQLEQQLLLAGCNYCMPFS